MSTFLLLHSPGTNHVLAMCFGQLGPNHGPTMCFGLLGHGISCQPSWISSFYIFWYIQFEVDLGSSKPRQIDPHTNQYTSFPIGYNGKLQIYKIIFKIYGLWFQNTLFIPSRFILVIFFLVLVFWTLKFFCHSIIV